MVQPGKSRAALNRGPGGGAGRALVAVCIAWTAAAPWGLPAGVARGQDAGPAMVTPAPSAAATTRPAGEAVPEAFLARMRAQYVSEDRVTPDITDNDKVRRYRTILREGAWAERQYPAAGNLHEVRQIMLNAAKGLATLEASDESRRELLRIAARLTHSDAPPEARVFADVLLTRTRMEALGPQSEAASFEVLSFLARYHGGSARGLALICTAELADVVGDEALKDACLKHLQRDFVLDDAVRDFLVNRGVHWWVRQPFRETLPLLDGGRLVLPRDLIGKLTLLHFWSIASLAEDRQAEAMAAAHRQHHADGLEIVAINLDRDPRPVRDLIAVSDWDWIHVHSGQGPRDPVFRRYWVSMDKPTWMVGPDGRVAYDGWDKKGRVGEVPVQMDGHRDGMARLIAVRSGEFLLDVPGACPPAASAGAGDVPPAALEALRRQMTFVPAAPWTTRDKARAYRQALTDAAALDQAHPGASSRHLLRMWAMVAAKWLAVWERDTAAGGEALATAQRVLADQAPPGPQLLARYVTTAAQVGPGDGAEYVAERVRGFVDAQRGTDLAWAATCMGIVLAMETGQDSLRADLQEALAAEHIDADPAVRPFLRDACGARADHPPFQADLTRLDGSRLRLPEDLHGHVLVVHFWSLAHPPPVVPQSPSGRRPQDRVLTGLFPEEERLVSIVGVNLDPASARADVERFAAGQALGWTHTFSGRGWDDSLARRYGVIRLPAAMVVDRAGSIRAWGLAGRKALDYAIRGSFGTRAPETQPATAPTAAR